MEASQQTAERKNQHLELCSQQPEQQGPIPFDSINLPHNALPERDFSEIDTHCTFLNQSFPLPLMVSGMTGGSIQGKSINAILAEVCADARIPLGLGSQKIAFTGCQNKNEFDEKLLADFDLKRQHPNLFLIGNIGAVSLNYGVSIDAIARMCDRLKLDAFALHLNPLQECIQPEGERNFNRLSDRIAALCTTLAIPVIVKEVGFGIHAEVFTRLSACGVQAIDVGGTGGTNWSQVEGQRGDAMTQRLGDVFNRWGIATDDALQQCQRQRNGSDSPELIATGGIRNGLQLAKACAIGAQICGASLPFLKAATAKSPATALRSEIAFFHQGLKIAMFCSGAGSLSDLHRIYNDTLTPASASRHE